jgi:hypothetical protein
MKAAFDETAEGGVLISATVTQPHSQRAKVSTHHFSCVVIPAWIAGIQGTGR